MRLLNFLSYPRGFLITTIGAVWTLLVSMLVLLVAFLTRNQYLIDFIIKTLWSNPVLKLSGVKIEVRGLNNVPQGGKGFLLLFNHSSNMDIPVLYSNFPRQFRFGAKIELFKIP